MVCKSIVGFIVVLQQTPRAVTVTPPPTVTFPPALAEFMVMSFNGLVVTVVNVEKVDICPYAIPTLLVA